MGVAEIDYGRGLGPKKFMISSYFLNFLDVIALPKPLQPLHSQITSVLGISHRASEHQDCRDFMSSFRDYRGIKYLFMLLVEIESLQTSSYLCKQLL